MKGNKITFAEGNTFYKEYSENEFCCLKMLHGYTGLEIDTIMKDGVFYITMPLGNVISIDTISKNYRDMIKSIIIENIPFMLDQINYLNNINIYYSDCLQWLYLDNKMYLIDMDVSYNCEIDYAHNNHDLLINFLNAFDIFSGHITESLNYLDLFKSDGFSLIKEKTEMYNRLNDETMTKNHIYFSRNQRHIQLNSKNICIYGETGNMIITERLLDHESKQEWELLRIV